MKNGKYILVVAPPNYQGKKYRGRYCYEHHLIWWKKHGQLPTGDKVIHHKNHKTTDNRLRNLEMITRQAHNKLHADERRKPLESTPCVTCGKPKLLRGNNLRFKRSRGILMFCSRACIGKYNFGKHPKKILG